MSAIFLKNGGFIVASIILRWYRTTWVRARIVALAVFAAIAQAHWVRSKSSTTVHIIAIAGLSTLSLLAYAD